MWFFDNILFTNQFHFNQLIIHILFTRYISQIIISHPNLKSTI